MLRRTPRFSRTRMNESAFDNYRNRRRIYESSEVDDFIEDIEKAYKKYFNKPKIYAFLILDDNLFIIDIKSAQNALEYFRDNYDDEDENE